MACAGTNPNETESVDGRVGGRENLLFEVSQNQQLRTRPHHSIDTNYICDFWVLDSIASPSSHPCQSFTEIQMSIIAYTELVIYLITFISNGKSMAKSTMGTLVLHICYSTIALSSVVNVMNVMTRENRGGKKSDSRRDFWNVDKWTPGTGHGH